MQLEESKRKASAEQFALEKQHMISAEKEQLRFLDLLRVVRSSCGKTKWFRKIVESAFEEPIKR